MIIIFFFEFFFFFQAEDGIRDGTVTGVQTCALPISGGLNERAAAEMEMKPNQLATTKLSDLAPAETAADTGADSSTTANVRNWMECVRTRKKPNADIEAGYNHSVALCMTVAAMHSGRKVMFDDSKRDIVMG